jgi:hypothetical protein
LVSVDSYVDKNGVSSAIGVAIVYDSLETPGNGVLLISYVISCGRNQVENCAKLLLPTIDEAVEYLRKSWPDLWKNLSVVKPE